METDVAVLDTDSVSDSNEDNVVDLIEEINNSFLTLWVRRVSTVQQVACLPSSYQAKSWQYCGPNGPTASIIYGI